MRNNMQSHPLAVGVYLNYLLCGRGWSRENGGNVMPECKTIKHNYDIGVITHEVKVWFRIFLKELIHKEVGWTIWLPLDSVPFVGFHPLWGSVHTLGYVQNRRDQFLDQIDRFVPTIPRQPFKVRSTSAVLVRSPAQISSNSVTGANGVKQASGRHLQY
jgi:hypothetical protein